MIDRASEERHLASCLEVIQDNIARYEAETDRAEKEIQDMFDHYHSDNPEMYTMLSNTITMNDLTKDLLQKNKRALPKPYFGRIDYRQEDKDFSLYLGKNGVSKSATETVVVDWRAPAATIYYDNELGPGDYIAPKGVIEIELDLKRTYEVENSKLIDFYDSQVVTNDELLTKYLAKNKEEVLGEIIATIQKEQNEIIRQTPFKNVIVQGVAGSGKTTVAMHRISFILYNYKEKFRPSEFFIVGSNTMLLNYITAVLPELDVNGAQQMTMEKLMIWLLEEDYSEKKIKVIQQESASDREQDKQTDYDVRFITYKGSIAYLKDLEAYLDKWEIERIPCEPIIFDNETIYTTEAIEGFIHENKDWSMQQKINMLNTRLDSKLTNILSSLEYEGKERKEKKAPYKNHFGKDKWKGSIVDIYYDYLEQRATGKEDDRFCDGFDRLAHNIAKKQFDVYDVAALNLIRWRLKLTEKISGIKHVVVDEAQDYGALVFAVLKKILPECTFTIMGDVSQNINYDAGMNDWETLREHVFSGSRDYFAVLAKSYRNTIEISEYASAILKKCSFKTYDIEPIIRHGRAVHEIKKDNEEEKLTAAAEEIKDWQNRGYDTIAVICRNTKEALCIRDKLAEYVEIRTENPEEAVFGKGIMVLPIQLTKGLEFDTVLLWDVTEKRYPINDANAKLLYVAATRALHELTTIGQLS